MKDFLKELFHDTPVAIKPSREMVEPNDIISIYKGVFSIKSKEESMVLNGEIYFEWFPNIRVVFKGSANIHSDKLKEFASEKDLQYQIFVEHDLLGKGYLDGFQAKSYSNQLNLSGFFYSKVFIGDKTIPVQKLRFSIPNLRAFHGDSVKESTKSTGAFKNRVILENKEYKITIDKSLNYDELKGKLAANGGYINFYGGEIVPKKGNIQIDKLGDFLKCLNTFLSFLNGSNVAILFTEGVFENEIIWTNYTSSKIDTFKYVSSWPDKNSFEGINEAWILFCDLWSEKDNKSVLQYIVNWYIISNRQEAMVEGSIILVQTALELIYNWLIIERKKIIIGKDSENISASNKIRLILFQIGLKCSVPSDLNEMCNYVENNKDIINDAPEAFVQIRNAIVHSQEEKRKKLKDIPDFVIAQALKLGISYIEASMLHVLKFRGVYFDRCKGKYVKEI